MIFNASTWTILAAAAVAATIAGPPAFAAAAETARHNVIQSQRYDRLLETNRGFRQARMRKECGPINDQELRQQCLASFNQDEPYAGSSASRRNYRSESGR